MYLYFYYSDEIDFNNLPIARQKEILQTDAYNVLILYFSGKYDDIMFLAEIQRFANHSVFTFQELINFLKPRVIYEAYQSSIGKSVAQTEELKRRCRYIENL